MTNPGIELGFSAQIESRTFSSNPYSTICNSVQILGNMDIWDEINGLPGYASDVTLHQNMAWANHLADVILSRPSVPDVSSSSPP